MRSRRPMHTYMHAYTRIHPHIHACIYTHPSTHTCMHACIYMHPSTCMHARTVHNDSAWCVHLCLQLLITRTGARDPPPVDTKVRTRTHQPVSCSFTHSVSQPASQPAAHLRLHLLAHPHALISLQYPDTHIAFFCRCAKNLRRR